MAFSDVATSAGRLFVGALRYISGGITSFAKGAAENAKVGNTAEEQQVAAAVRVREMIVRTFGHLPWYLLLAMAVVCLGIGVTSAAIEIKNLSTMLESIATEAEKVKIFGISVQLATAALILVAESVFGFVLFAAKYSIPWGLRIGISITAWSMAVIIISGNFTTLKKRDIMLKRADENQHQIVELTKHSQKLADRAMASAEKAVTATEKNGATSATRAGAVAAERAADVAKEQAIMIRQVASQLEKAPPPANSEVQGEFWSQVLKMLGAVTMFAIQAFAMRLAGLFTLMSRHEYVANRREVNAAPNLKTADVSKRKALPDAPPPPPKPQPAPRPEPVPAFPAPRLKERGGLGTGRNRTPVPSPAPALPVPGVPLSEPVEQFGTGSEPDFDELPAPEPVKNPTREAEDGRVIIGQLALVDKRAEPVLRALLMTSLEDVSASKVVDALKATKVRPQGMAKNQVLACLKNLEQCGYLERTKNGYRHTSKLKAARDIVRNKGAVAADINDLIYTMVQH